MKFGVLLKDYRIKVGMTLRECAAMLDFDPSNWSKVERNVSAAPKLDVVREWADALRIPTDELQGFYDSAALSRNEVPEDICSNARAITLLPLFFKGVREDNVDQLIADISALWSR